MSQPEINVPFANTYWVVPSQLLAGEHPVELDERITAERLTALLDAGVRTFVNLTEQREIKESYSHSLRSLAADKGMAVEIIRMPIPDRGVPSAEALRSILEVIDGSIAKG